MKILLTNQSLQYVGGTEKWTYTMAKCLADRGHEIDVLTLMEGMTSERMVSFARIADKPLRPEYDLILANHGTAFYRTRETDGFKVFTSHGPTHRLEMPIGGADVYVGVSKEVVSRRLSESFPKDMLVITNGVDLTDFRPPSPRPIRDVPHVLVACKSAEAGNLACAAAEASGCTVEPVHYLSEPVWDMAARMRGADMVVGAGRTAIEALACGANVLCYDMRSKPHGPRTDGWITAVNVNHLAQVNFSTRAYGNVCDYAALVKLFATRPESGTWQRAWAEENADIQTKADAYLSLLPKQDPVIEPDLTAEYEGVSV